MSLLLKTFINLLVKETLTSKQIEQIEQIEQQEEELTEFSGAAGVGGYSLPLGMNPDDAGRKKNKTS